MSILQDLYNLSAKEAMSLSDKEVAYLSDRAQAHLITGALTSGDIQSALRSRLEPTMREVRAARSAGTPSEGSTSGAIGAPPYKP